MRVLVGLIAVSALSASPALAQQYKFGDKVQGSASGASTDWADCLVTGPANQNGWFPLTCPIASQPGEMRSFYAPPSRIRPEKTAADIDNDIKSEQFKVGQMVEGNPTGVDRVWLDCVVKSRPNANGWYQLSCPVAGQPGETTDYWTPPQRIREPRDQKARDGEIKGQPFQVGDMVEANPTGVEGNWQKCMVKSPQNYNGWFQMTCPLAGSPGETWDFWAPPARIRSTG